MSADKYAQFIAEQQRKLSVSGTNTIDLQEGAKPEVSVHSGAAHVKNAKGETVASYSRKQHGADFMKKANAHMAKLKEEAIEEKKELSPKQKKIAAQAGDPEKIEGEDFKKLRGEEVEQIDELSIYKMQAISKKASARNKDYSDPKGIKHQVYGTEVADDKIVKRAGVINPSTAAKVTDWVAGKLKTKALKNKKTIPRNVEEELISIEEQTYLEEMVGKGKLPSILQHHKENMLHHEKMSAHHNMMADKSEAVGDSHGFDHHIGQSMEHEYQYQHHKARYDHAASLGMKAKALKQVKAAKTQMDIANKALSDAKADKREY